jgi:hypothetical protein
LRARGDGAAIAAQRRENKRRLQLRSPRVAAAIPVSFSLLARYAVGYRRLLSVQQVDAVTVEFAQMGYYRLPPGVPAVLDQHNVE